MGCTGDHDDERVIVAEFGTVKANVPDRRREAATITFMVVGLVILIALCFLLLLGAGEEHDARNKGGKELAGTMGASTPTRQKNSVTEALLASEGPPLLFDRSHLRQTSFRFLPFLVC